jgi:hypothetical protein
VSPAIAPANGYIVKWRPVGTTTWNTVTQNQNPVVIAGVPTCFNIEGTIQASCAGGSLGSTVVFSVSSSSAECRSIRLLDTGLYSYTSCSSAVERTVNNLASSPTVICARDGTVSGGQFTDLNAACVS